MRKSVALIGYPSGILRPATVTLSAASMWSSYLMNACTTPISSTTPTCRVSFGDGDIVIPESAAIVLYLADKYREKKLLPASVGERARSIAGSCSPTLENQQAHGALSTPTLTRDGALRR